MTNRLAIGGICLLALAGCSDDSSFEPPGGSAAGDPSISITATSSGGSTVGYDDVVTVRISANETILAPSVTIAGGSADTLTGSANSWTATRTMQPTDPVGPIMVETVATDLVSGARIRETHNSGLTFRAPPLTDYYREVWAENFDGASLDMQSWNFQTGDGTAQGLPRGWGNNEEQIYAESQATVANGMLVITAASDGAGGYTSARITTEGKRSFMPAGDRNYRIDVRAKLPSGGGTWPAVWMLPEAAGRTAYGPWPQSGEIDIVEAYALGVNDRRTISSSIHYGFPWPDNDLSTMEHMPAEKPQDAFHIYSMEWQPAVGDKAAELRFFYDDVHYATFSSNNWYTVGGGTDNAGSAVPYTPHEGEAPFDQPFHFIANVAVGGNLPNSIGAIDPSVFPQTLEIDYIRVYECVDDERFAPLCSRADSSINPVGGPGSATVHPPLTLYAGSEGGLQPVTLTVRGTEYTNTPTISVFYDDGAAAGTPYLQENVQTAVDPATGGSRTNLWRFDVMGGLVNTGIQSETIPPDHVALQTGFDFRGADNGSRLVFDMYADSTGEGTWLLVKLDSGFPNLGEVPVEGIAMDEWRTYSIPIKRFVDSPRTGGSGVDLANVPVPFLVEPDNETRANIDLDIYLDNIRLLFACADDVPGGCAPNFRTKSIPGTGAVYENMVAAEWASNMLSAFDAAINYNSCVDDGGAGCPSISFTEVDAGERGDVIEVRYSGTQFAGLTVGQNLNGLDMSAFMNGTVEFDLRVTANPSNIAKFQMKVDCIECPVDAGQRQQNFDLPALNEWGTISIPVSNMINANGGPMMGGLRIGVVTTGLVLFPPFGMTEGIAYQLDNVRWAEPGASSLGTGAVYADALDRTQWPSRGVYAFDQDYPNPDQYGNCGDAGNDPCPSFGFEEVEEAGRGTIIRVTHTANKLGGMILGQNVGGLNLSEFAGGTLNFDIRVTANPSSAAFTMKTDCVGCPFQGREREQPVTLPTLNEWGTVMIPVDDMVNANGGPTSGGLKLEAVTTGLVIFPAAANAMGVVYELDNVRWVKQGGPAVVISGPGAVYGDAVDAQWTTNMIDAFDSQNGYNSGCPDDGGAACPSLSYSEVDVAGRGKVLQVVYDTSAVHAGIVVGLASGGLDFSQFAGGTVKFDIRVTANPDTTANFRAKADCTGASGCGFASNAREQVIGMLPLNMWQEISINVDDMVNANGGPTAGDGLQLSGVTTGLVLFPEHSKASGVTFQLDNIRWEAP